MSRDECVNADWRTIGFEDGSNGAAPGRIGNHRKACASHNIVPDRDNYLAGYQEGNQLFCTFERGQREGQYGNRANDLCAIDTSYPAGYQEGQITYCTYDMGYQAGLNGEEYLRVCPSETEANFLAGYDFGTEVHRLSQEISEQEARLVEIVNFQKENDTLIEELRHEAVFNRELSAEERVEILADIKALDKSNEELEAEYEAIGIEISRLHRKRQRLINDQES